MESGWEQKDELRAVLGHEMSHIKHRDIMVMPLLFAIPLIMYWIAWGTMFRGALGGRDQGGAIAILIGMGAMELRSKTVELGSADKMMEVLSTHPNMLRRIRHLSSLVA